MNHKLAITIPYYKIGHFREVLEALAKQTNQNFNVYIGDDCSPDDPTKIIDKYKDKLNISYTRFEKNLGGISLPKQWDRTTYLNKGEEWLWVLPDDDIPSSNCVEEFYKALPNVEEYDIKIFRMPLKFIDGEGMSIDDPVHTDPLLEDNLSFYNKVIRGSARSSLGDNIFHRQTFEESGAFVDFPKSWGGDHATVLKVSSGGNLYFLEKASLSFRMSGDNISSETSDGVIKMRSRIQFAKWLKNNEHIFPEKPDSDFYKYFYWKGEYYVLNEWEFSLVLLKELYTLRKICFGSVNVLPILKVLFQKIGLIK